VPQDLSAAGQDSYDPQVAVDGHGTAIAVWSRSNGTNLIVQAAARAAGGSFGAPQDLSAAGQKAGFPQVAIDGQGNAIAVWSRFDGTNYIAQTAARAAASRPRWRYFTPKPGGSFGAPQDLSAVGQKAGFAQVAIDGQGNAIAVWSRFDGTNFIVQAAARAAASRRRWRYFTPKRGGSFGAPQDLSAASQDAFNPQVAFDGQGNAIAVWHRFDAGTNTIVQAAARAADSRRRRRYFTPKRGGSFGAPQDLSAAGQNASFPEVAVDGQGNAIAVWRRFDGTNFIVQAAARAAGGSFGAPQDLSAAGQKAGFPEVAVDGQGNAIAVWQRFDGTNFIMQAAARAAGGSFGAPQDLSAAGQTANDPQVAVDGQGNAIAVWSRSNGTNDIVQAAVRAAGGSFGAPQDLSAAGQDAHVPEVAVDGQGNAIAVWSRSNGTNYIVQAAVRAAGPQTAALAS
jgi:hypothetical protein